MSVVVLCCAARAFISASWRKTVIKEKIHGNKRSSIGKRYRFLSRKLAKQQHKICWRGYRKCRIPWFITLWLSIATGLPVLFPSCNFYATFLDVWRYTRQYGKMLQICDVFYELSVFSVDLTRWYLTSWHNLCHQQYEEEFLGRFTDVQTRKLNPLSLVISRAPYLLLTLSVNL